MGPAWSGANVREDGTAGVTREKLIADGIDFVEPSTRH
jgi:hypothetical protein